MYVEELRQYRAYLQKETVVDELRGLNLLGVQVSFFFAQALWGGAHCCCNPNVTKSSSSLCALGVPR